MVIEEQSGGCSSMVERKLPKLNTGVRFPSPAPDFAIEVYPVMAFTLSI